MHAPHRSAVPRRSFAAPRGSLYLLSAALVLLGGYLNLHDWHGNPTTVAMGDVFGTHLAYEAALVLGIALLFRVRGEVRDTVTLLAVLAVFLCDGLLVQHLYGWEKGDGLTAAAIGAASATLLLALTAWILAVNPCNRLFAGVLGAVLFGRFAPALLVAAAPGPAVAPRFVALGWLFAALPLVAYLPSLGRVRSRLPLAVMERWGIAFALAVTLLHLVNAGQSFDLSFHLLYLAPFLVVLAPALEQIAPELSRHPAGRRLVGALPYLGLALAASTFPPGLLAAHWAQAWPLTPFYLVLLLTALVQIGRGVSRLDSTLIHVGTLLLVLAGLGGDFPEILTAACFPLWWQVLAVNALAWATIVRARDLKAGTGLSALAAFVTAGFAAESGYPWTIAFLLMLGWAALALEALTRWALKAPVRLAVVATVTLLPVVTALAAPDSRLRAAVATVTVAIAYLLGWRRHDRLLVRLAPLAALVALLGYPLSIEHRTTVSPGRLVTELGFAILALGFVHSVYGGKLRGQWRLLWQDDAGEAPIVATTREARS